MNLFLVFVYFCSAFFLTEGLRCYTCSKGEMEQDTTCITEPELATQKNCDKKYCVTIRREYKDATHRVADMFRGCQDIKVDETIEDDTYRVYYRSCITDLCNGGTGKEDSNLGNNDNVQGIAGTLYVKGTGAAFQSAIVMPFLIVVLVVTVTFL